MKVLSTAAIVFATLSLASPSPDKRHGHKACLSDSDAEKIVKLWTTAFAGDINAIPKVATKDIEVYDNSVNFLFNTTVDQPYIKGLDNGGSTTSIPGFKQVVLFPKPYFDVSFDVVKMLHDCSSISFRWTFKGKSYGPNKDFVT
ncbi:hypothetical protein K440DRAFT_644170 [Wilcoxina mikolae CBS 423.85]|nr:hypothetical protein K440DRAFT_644170 [Wilcoxina mikolae CBS 423.85]